MSDANENSPATPRPATPPGAAAALGSVFRHLRHVGRDVLSVAAGKWLDRPPEREPPPADPNHAASTGLDKRVNLLHGIAQKFRGAADDYIAAKMDEIEARVDLKLDHIEQRIDRKIVELHQQLAEMRDRELRHRLRILKITLIFTVLVALLSLGYNWVAQHWT